MSQKALKWWVLNQCMLNGLLLFLAIQYLLIVAMSVFILSLLLYYNNFQLVEDIVILMV